MGKIELTGEAPEYLFSGWAASLTPSEREFVEERRGERP